ncbi:hypothetical protein [Arthrobacter sp. SO5]|uniref:hypothetical protein n=1 Tax=Arthrobacter sp. SO5 TaxID=1897055 RepID=UPI001E634A69|nr:hypothetical protein [Arthrobacter sp. SO5]
MLLRFPMTAGGCPPSPTEYRFRAVVHFKAGGLGQSQQLACQADQVVSVSFVRGLLSVEVYAEALDDASLVRVLRRQMVDVYGLGSKLDAE